MEIRSLERPKNLGGRYCMSVSSKRVLWKDTLVDVMCEKRLATRSNAIMQINDCYGEDLVGIGCFVKAGLNSLENQLCLKPNVLFDEKLDGLECASAYEIIQALHEIHLEWRENNWEKFLERFILNDEGVFCNTDVLEWDRVGKNFIFIKNYLEAAGVDIKDEELRREFEIWAKTEFAYENPSEVPSDFKFISDSIIRNSEQNLLNLTTVFEPKLRQQLNEAVEKSDAVKAAKIRKRLSKVDDFIQHMYDSSSDAVVKKVLIQIGWLLEQ